MHVRRLAQIPTSALTALLDPNAAWTASDENLAMLAETQAHALQLQWSAATYDPDDPETKREAELARRRREKPPKKPIVPPSAHRPAGLAQRRFDEYVAALSAHYGPPKEHVTGRRAFDAAHGLD